MGAWGGAGGLVGGGGGAVDKSDAREGCWPKVSRSVVILLPVDEDDPDVDADVAAGEGAGLLARVLGGGRPASDSVSSSVSDPTFRLRTPISSLSSRICATVRSRTSSLNSPPLDSSPRPGTISLRSASAALIFSRRRRSINEWLALRNASRVVLALALDTGRFRVVSCSSSYSSYSSS